MKAQNLVGIGVGAMMRVMEERAEAEALLARKDLMHHLRLIPFVNDDQVGAGEFVIEKGRKALVTPVEANVELGIRGSKAINGTLPGFTLVNQVAQRPCADLLIAANLMSHAHQFAQPGRAENARCRGSSR